MANIGKVICLADLIQFWLTLGSERVVLIVMLKSWVFGTGEVVLLLIWLGLNKEEELHGRDALFSLGHVEFRDLQAK